MTTAATLDRACSTSLMNEGDEAIKRLPLPLVADIVAKVFLGGRRKFPRTADAFRIRRCEGPHCFPRKRPRTLASAMPSVAAVELSRNLLSRDSWRRSIFDFCNNIGTYPTSGAYAAMSAPRLRPQFWRSFAQAIWKRDTQLLAAF